MIVHGFVVTAELQTRLLHHVRRAGTFRNADLIAAIRDQAAQNISKCIALGQITSRRVDVGEICMRSADVLIKAWKKSGDISQGAKRGDWIVTAEAKTASWSR